MVCCAATGTQYLHQVYMGLCLPSSWVAAPADEPPSAFSERTFLVPGSWPCYLLFVIYHLPPVIPPASGIRHFRCKLQGLPGPAARGGALAQVLVSSSTCYILHFAYHSHSHHPLCRVFFVQSVPRRLLEFLPVPVRGWAVVWQILHLDAMTSLTPRWPA
jgi:hypothetical protein